MIHSRDDSVRLIETVQAASDASKPISIVGHGSKSRYVSPRQGDEVHTADHVGIIEYQPDELMISVRSGTPITDISAILDDNQQVLACDPPRFDGLGTIGGAVACDLNGPGRPWFGTIRDAVLGVEVINGLGEKLEFGGRVMKNVAGFDVSRLMAGSFGVFGVLLTVNLRVHPKSEHEYSVQYPIDGDAIHEMHIRSLRNPSLITATCYFDGMMSLRLSGRHAGVMGALGSFNEYQEIDSEFWSSIRDHTHTFFREAQDLHRVSLARGQAFQSVEPHPYMQEWAGSRVWLSRDSVAEDGQRWVSKRFKSDIESDATRSKYVKRLRQAFDPKGIFNQDLFL